MTDIDIYGDFQLSGHREVNIYLTACDSKKRPTCKSREEISAFLARSTFHMYSIDNIVVEDQFSSDMVDSTKFKGDYNSYFPI